MNQQYQPTPTRRDFVALCPNCGREHRLHTSDTHGARCVDCFTELKMPPTVAAEGRQNEISQPEYNTKEEKAQ